MIRRDERRARSGQRLGRREESDAHPNERAANGRRGGLRIDGRCQRDLRKEVPLRLGERRRPGPLAEREQERAEPRAVRNPSAASFA
jgi:hypothetical protein